jgi:hypothetical protein
MYTNSTEALAALNKLSFDGLTSTQAKTEKLLEYVQQLPIDAEGRITVLYSGRTADGNLSFADIAKDMGKGPNTRVIDKTIAAKVISNDIFTAKLSEAFASLDVFNETPKDHPNKVALNNWLYSGTDGPWAKASERFAQATTGVVKIMTEAPNPNGVFLKTELPAIVKNVKSGLITDIAGLSGDRLRTGGLSEAELGREIFLAAKTETLLTKPTIESYTYLLENTVNEQTIRHNMNRSVVDIITTAIAQMPEHEQIVREQLPNLSRDDGMDTA